MGRRLCPPFSPCTPPHLLCFLHNMCYHIRMNTLPQTIEFGTQRLPASLDGQLYAPAALRALGLDMPADWAAFAQQHGLELATSDFGAGEEPTLSVPEFAALAFALETPGARR